MGPALPSLQLAVPPLEHVLGGRDGPLPPLIASELRAIVARLRDLARTGGRAPSVLCREADYWTLAHDGTLLRLRHSKGMAYLAQLLVQPDVELHALVIESGRPVAHAWSAPRLDREARAAYRGRLTELQGAIADAHRRGDAARAAQLEAEASALLHELATGVGLGGRDRTFADAAERARVNVTRNVHAAIARIACGHAALGRHLATSVRTGAFCRYAPDPAAAVHWQVAA